MSFKDFYEYTFGSNYWQDLANNLNLLHALLRLSQQRAKKISLAEYNSVYEK